MEIIPKRLKRQWLISLIMFLATAAVFLLWDEVYIDHIVDMQLASDLETFQKFTDHQKYNLENHLKFDFLFIIIYSLFFLYSSKVASLWPKLKIKPGFLLLSFLPGFFDLFENIAMLNLLHTPTISLHEMLYFSARLKWICYLPLMVLSLLVLEYMIVNLVRAGRK